MKTTLISVAVTLLFAVVSAQESNDSPAALTNAQAQVALKLEQFSRMNTNYDLLLQAQKISASMNQRGSRTNLEALDEGCLRLQLKVLLALTAAGDAHYDWDAPSNRIYLNMAPPLADSNGVSWPSGVDPGVIRDPKARKAYEDELEANRRRIERLNREVALSRAADYAVIDIYYFIHGFPEDSRARKRAFEIIDQTVTDAGIRRRLESEEHPGLRL